MKITVLKPTEIEITHIRVSVPVRYADEDMPYDYPLRDGNWWRATIDLETGQIENWPGTEEPTRFHMKVCDEGSYYLLDESRNVVASIEREYAPNDVVPGEYGDYLIFQISTTGEITNWKTPSDFSAFFPTED